MRGGTEQLHGWSLQVNADGTHILNEHRAAPTLAYLQKAVGGSIELVPYFNFLVYNGTMARVIAYCNADGKNIGLPDNRVAHALWERAVGRRISEDYLVGNIIILWGDARFMEEL